jgi:hypothetical protein
MFRPTAASARIRNGMKMARIRYSPFQRPDLIGVEHRNADEGEREQNPQRDAILADRKDRHVGGVAGLELAGLSIKHVSPLSHDLIRTPVPTFRDHAPH